MPFFLPSTATWNKRNRKWNDDSRCLGIGVPGCVKLKKNLCNSICFSSERMIFPINREIYLHKRTCEMSHKYYHVGKKDTRKRRRNEILSRSQKALPRKAFQLFARSCLNVKIVFLWKKRALSIWLFVQCWFLCMSFFCSTKISIFTSFKRVSVFSLSRAVSGGEERYVLEKKGKRKCGLFVQ